jgi:glutaredoxin-dependent peroxiredoxin
MSRTNTLGGGAPRAARRRLGTRALAAFFLLAGAGPVAAQQPAAPTGAGRPPQVTGSAAVTVKAPVGINVGEVAPDFKLPYATKEKIFSRPEEQMSLSSLRGKTVVLAFYPADWSGGCTAEVCTFRDSFMDLGRLNAVVLGISGDYVFSHHEWAKHHNLPFALLSDHDHKVAKAYNSYMEQYGMNKRTVFVIDKDGFVRYANLAFKANEKKDYDALRAEIEKLSGAASAARQ